MSLKRLWFLAPVLFVLLTLTAMMAALRTWSAPSPVAHTEVAQDADADQLTPSRTSATRSCGVFRWSVKTGTDGAAGSVNQSSTTPTTISTQRGIPAPLYLLSNSRVSPVETTVYSIDATITEFALEADSDYHVVVSDGSGNTMITEIPDPACVGARSPFKSSIQNARAAFDAMFTPTPTFQKVHQPVRVSGVGFWDFVHGQNGVAPNGIELHPILGISFGSVH